MTEQIRGKIDSMKPLADSGPQVRLRLLRAGEIALGPGKVSLLDAIDKEGSINRAAKQLGMSYKRAWDLVNTMNRHFSEPLVLTSKGGEQGGGAKLSATGRQVRDLYHHIEEGMLSSQSQALEQLQALMQE